MAISCTHTKYKTLLNSEPPKDLKIQPTSYPETEILRKIQRMYKKWAQDVC